MATRNQQSQSNPIETYIRAIVRSEIHQMFSGLSQEDDGEYAEVEMGGEPTTLNAAGASSTDAGSTGGRRRRRRGKNSGKGRATNPATDRRFKGNNASGNA